MAKVTIGNSGNRIGFAGMLCIVFIVLKLCGVIDWWWGWVLAPIWLVLAVIVAIFAVFGIIYLIAAILDAVKPRGKAKK